MYTVKNIMWLYALSSVHAGSGDDLNYIDLPIQRERYTGFPKIEASSVKGGIRYAMEAGKDETVRKRTARILGKQDQNDFASAVAISDARLLFFPVKSAKGIFAWVTCPMAVRRFVQDCEAAGIRFKEQMDWLDATEKTLTGEGTALGIDRNDKLKKQIMLEEFVFEYVEDRQFLKWLKSLQEALPEQSLIKQRFLTHSVLLRDDDFEYFVTQSTEVTTRIRIEHDSGVTKENALFTEEYLPPESLLYSPLFFSEAKQAQNGCKEKEMSASDVETEFDVLLESNILQIGGDMTLGKGLFYRKMWKKPGRSPR